MSIGATVNISIPVTGTTVDSLAKTRDGLYVGDFSLGGNLYPNMLVYRTANVLTNRKRFGATYKISPSMNDDPGSISKGTVSVSINIDAVVGSVITSAELANQVRYALSAFLASTVVETLRDGSLQ